MIINNSRTLTVRVRLDHMKATSKRKCIMCKSFFRGRSDKKFCTITCKSTYHKKLSAHTHRATKKVDKILHRNRSILQELMGKKVDVLQISREVLDAKKFSYDHITGYHKNSMNKVVHYVYDFSWVIFSDKNLLVKRLNKR